MKKSLVIIISSLFGFAMSAQVAIKDRELQKRLDEYMMLNKELNFKKLIDYIHPSLFKIAPKKDIIQAFEQTFNNDKVEIRFDSLKVTSIEPSFKYHEIIYQKVNYYTSMELKVRDSTLRANENYPESLIRTLSETEEVYMTIFILSFDLHHKYSICLKVLLLSIKTLYNGKDIHNRI